jgi:hypothetical protein
MDRAVGIQRRPALRHPASPVHQNVFQAILDVFQHRCADGLFVLIVIWLWLLLLLDYVLLLSRRLIDQRGSIAVFVSVFGKYQPRLRHVQERKPNFRVRGFASKFDALSGVCSIQLDTACG